MGKSDYLMKRVAIFSAAICAIALYGCESAKDGYGWVVSSVGLDAESAYTAAAKQTLDGLVSAYQDKSALAFMSWVSDDYPGAPEMLDSRIRDSFTRYFYIEITYTLTSVVPSDDGAQLSVNVQFSRKLGNKETGAVESENDSTNLILIKASDGTYKLLQMHRPILFP